MNDDDIRRLDTYPDYTRSDIVAMGKKMPNARAVENEICAFGIFFPGCVGSRFHMNDVWKARDEQALQWNEEYMAQYNQRESDESPIKNTK